MTQVTPSVTGLSPNCRSTFSSLINLRNGTTIQTPHVLTTTIVGRTSGNNIPFLTETQGLYSTYEDYKMRRKAETLKYRNGASSTAYNRTASDNFANVVKTGGSYNYSSTRLLKIINQNKGTFPADCRPGSQDVIVHSTPSSAGIHDNQTGYLFLNPYVKYYPSL